MNVDGIEVSSFCSGCTLLFDYVIKREYVSTDKGLILACAVTYRQCPNTEFRNFSRKKIGFSKIRDFVFPGM